MLDEESLAPARALSPGLPVGWHVLHTKSRQEKTLATFLASRQIAYYLPLVRSIRFHGHRKAVVDAPLFSGYLFLWGTREQAFEADRTGRVAGIITVNDPAKLTHELESVRLALTSRVPLALYPRLKKGLRAEVKAGPLKGIQGVIVGRGRNSRFFLNVTVLSQSAELEIDASLLEPVD